MKGMGRTVCGGDLTEFVVDGVAWVRLIANILGITIFGIMQYLQAISCIFG